jgi:hypothetical protein
MPFKFLLNRGFRLIFFSNFFIIFTYSNPIRPQILFVSVTLNVIAKRLLAFVCDCIISYFSRAKQKEHY